MLACSIAALHSSSRFLAILDPVLTGGFILVKSLNLLAMVLEGGFSLGTPRCFALASPRIHFSKSQEVTLYTLLTEKKNIREGTIILEKGKFSYAPCSL